jgi:hypothetical protein
MKKYFVPACLISLSLPVRADIVQDWQNPIHYPARVIAVQWENGRLDAKTSMKLGAWTMSFGPPVQCAVDFHFPDGRSLAIGGDNCDIAGSAAPYRKRFHCRNAAVGDRFCDLALLPKCQLRIYYTKTYIPDNWIDIPCPTALELAQ